MSIPNRRSERYSLRSDCTEGSCSCTNTPDLPRSAPRCRNSRNIDDSPKSAYTNTTPIHSSTGSSVSSYSNSPRPSSLKNGSLRKPYIKYHRVHWPDNLICTKRDSHIWNTSTSQKDAIQSPYKNGNGHAVRESVEMSTTSSAKVYRKFSKQKFQFDSGAGDGSYVSNKSYNDDQFAHPGYRTSYYARESISVSGSGKGSVSGSYVENHREGNGSVIVAENEDDFLHRKTTSNFRNRYTSDGFDVPAEQTFIRKVLSVPINYLSKAAWYIYTFMVHVLVMEKWVLKKSNNVHYRGDPYYYNLRTGYANNGTNVNEGYSAKFRHFLFSNNKIISNHNDISETKRRNVVVYNNTSTSSKSANNSFANNSHYSEDHLSDEEHFSSSWNRSRGLCLGCLKIFSALLLLATLGYLAFLLWSPISSFASATSDFVGSCLSSIITNISSVSYYFGSLFLIGSSKTSDPIVVVPRVPVTEKVVNIQTDTINVIPIPAPSPPIISKEELDEILSRLRSLEDKITDHDSKLVLSDSNYNKLNVRLAHLETAMQEASAKGKTSDQIVQEMIHFKLGETEDGKIVTLHNIVTMWNTNSKEERSNMDIKLRALAAKLAAEADTSKAERDEIKIDYQGLKLGMEGMQLKIADTPKPVEVDLDKLKASMLPLLMSEIESKVKISCETRDCPEPSPGGGSTVVGGTQADLEKLIKMAIAKYDADKTGLPDLALESAGGTILSTRCTKSSKLRNSVVSFFGFKIWSPPNNPRTIIQPGVVPGECWAFEGSVGDIVIQLVAPSIVTGFTVEHISKNVSPYNNIDSAPYKFEVWGLNAENDFDTMWTFGTFSYEDNGETLQHFPVQNATAHAFPIIELKILSNHGNLRHTCLYRFRVHGALNMKVMNVKIEPHTSEV